MKKVFVAVMAMVMMLGVLAPVVLQTDTASACALGLSPGYWKNHTEVWDGTDPEWNGPLPGAYFDEVFGVVGLGPHVTLIDILNTGGGKWNALNRLAVASLLNSYGVPDAMAEHYVKAFVLCSYKYYGWQFGVNNLAPYIESD